MKIIDSFKDSVTLRSSDLLDDETVLITELARRPEGKTPFGKLVLGLAAENTWSSGFCFHATLHGGGKSHIVIHSAMLPNPNGTRAVVIREEGGIIPTVATLGIYLLGQYGRYVDALEIAMGDLRARRDEVGLQARVLRRDVAASIIAEKVGHSELSKPGTQGDLCFREDYRDCRLLCVRMSELSEFQVYEVQGVTINGLPSASSSVAYEYITSRMVLLK